MSQEEDVDKYERQFREAKERALSVIPDEKKEEWERLHQEMLQLGSEFRSRENISDECLAEYKFKMEEIDSKITILLLGNPESKMETPNKYSKFIFNSALLIAFIVVLLLVVY